MKQLPALAFLLLICFLLLSCEKEISEETTELSLLIKHEADGKPLQPDVMVYEQAPGNQYSISKLEYYISNIRLVDKQGKTTVQEGVFYVNGFDNLTTNIILPKVKPAAYSALIFNIGLLPATNKTGALPNTLVNANMAWPDPMGGGYHFLKFEGNYQTAGSSDTKGFAMHLGRNENLVEVTVTSDFRVDKQHKQLQLQMNLNEWFRHPHQLRFDADGSNSMFDQGYMQKLAQNGATIFSLITGN